MILPALLLSLLASGITPFPDPTDEQGVRRWGSEGHRMVGEAAAQTLPRDMPDFFRSAVDQLAYLNPEPDRWKAREERDLDPAMNSAHSSEHYINFEGVPERVFGARDRFAYLDSLKAHGFDIPGPGLLPYRILELTQRMRVGFREWRAATDPREREWIEQRIINDAGVLGHYVADGSNPAHTTIHHNGWVGENPRGYATDSRFHTRFESGFVRAQVRPRHVHVEMTSEVRIFADLRPAIFEYLGTSNGYVRELYEIDLRSPFSETNTREENRVFAAQRLAFGAEMLRDLWWTAWVTSDDSGPRELKL